MADDLEALREDSDGIKDQLAVMASLVLALTEGLLASQSGSEGQESADRPQQPSQPNDPEDVSQPGTTPEQSQGQLKVSARCFQNIIQACDCSWQPRGRVTAAHPP